MTYLGAFRDDFYNAAAVLAQAGTAPTTQASGTILGGPTMVGAQDQYVLFSGGAALAITTDSAVNIIAALQQAIAVAAKAQGAAGFAQGVQSPIGVPNLFNLAYTLTISNAGTGAITLTAGAGVTLVAGAAVAASGTVTFVVAITSPTTVSITRVGSGTV